MTRDSPQGGVWVAGARRLVSSPCRALAYLLLVAGLRLASALVTAMSSSTTTAAIRMPPRPWPTVVPRLAAVPVGWRQPHANFCCQSPLLQAAGVAAAMTVCISYLLT